MKLSTLHYNEGAHTPDYRKGRGVGSGNGKTAGKGHKGQKARSGGLKAPGFEGGQNPLYRRLPKFGFKHYGQIKYAIVNVETLNRFKEGTVVTPALLKSEKVIKTEYNGIKVLGRGEITVKLTVQAHKFSTSAKEAIEKAGGVCEVIE